MKNRLFTTVVLTVSCIFSTALGGSPSNSELIKDSAEIKIDTMIAHMGLSAKTPGGVVGVIRDGKFIFLKAYGLANFDTKEPNKTSTLFNLASVSKQYTAAAILLLSQENKLSLKDDIRKYLPDFPDYGYTITIENLVHHTSGIKSHDVLRLMAGKLYDTETMDEVYSMIIKQKALNFKPGDEYLYSNSGYVLLARIIEKVSGMKFSDFLGEKILKSTGMDHTLIYDNPEKQMINSAYGHSWGGEKGFKRSEILKSTVVGESNVYTCAEDFLKWDINFKNNSLGKWNFAEKMTSLTPLNDGSECNYAFGLEISEHKGLKTVSHQGGTGDFTIQYLQIPSENFSVVCLFNIGTDVTGLAYNITDLFLKGNQTQAETSIPPQKVKIDSTLLNKYTGKYFDENWWIEPTITRADDHLVFEAPYQGRFEIYPSSDTSFFATVADIKFVFRNKANGETAGTTLLAGKEKFYVTYLGQAISPLTSEKLSQFTGEYYSEEINASYPVIFKENKLYVRFPESTAQYCKTPVESELISEYADYFASPVGGMQFTRNAGNEISGFIIKNLGRVRNLEFTKTK
jgi:CubicO group peptidase (beta-lactamase class C family)